MKPDRREFLSIGVSAAAALVTGKPSSDEASKSEPSSESATAPLDYKNPQLPVERRVADLMGRMTLEEKVTQTYCLAIGAGTLADEKSNFSPEKASKQLRDGMGHIYRASYKRGPRENAVFANAIQKYLVESTRLGIPATFQEEALHGHMAPGGASFPQALALASTWDVELVEKVFRAIASEVRARGGQQVFTPVLNVAREPRWGRTEETYGEDPYLVSRIGVASVKGFQGTGPSIDKQHVVSTVKHFAAYGQPEGGINTAPANYSERIIREVFLTPFKAAVGEAGAQSLMAAYNEIDGIPCHANAWLLQRILRQEWGFQGFVTADDDGIIELKATHHVAANRADCAKRALEAGVDVELLSVVCYNTLAQQIREGRIAEATLDRAVAGILRAKFLLGLFEDPYVDSDYAEKVTNSDAHRELTRAAARKAIILLKNQGNLLPLDRKKIKSLAVIGPNAAKCWLGGYSDDPGRTVSILEGIREKVGKGIKVVYSKGCGITKGDRGWWDNKVELSNPAEDARRIAEAVKVARTVDVVVLALGGSEQTCRETFGGRGGCQHLGDRDSLGLLGMQNDLVKAILETGKPTVVFLINGRPLSINYIAENVPAILEGWYLGEETGSAVADVLFGDTNPGGKLPITIPRSVGQLPVYYNHKPSAERCPYVLSSTDPIFPFGHGLSYTTFRYENLSLTHNEIGPEGTTRVRVDVTNTGQAAGDEVVQLYIRDEVSSVTRPVKELRDFRRISLRPAETRTVEFVITPEKLAFWNIDMKWVVEPGTFEIMVGSSSVDVKSVRLQVVER